MLKQKKFLLLFILFVVVLIASMIKFSFSIKLDNDSKIDVNSEFIYYLDVTYDGVDKHGLASSDQVRSSITSDSILVEDKIPDGLIFNGFVIPQGEMFEAVSRDDSHSVCSGEIVAETKEEIGDRTYTWMSDGIALHTITALWGNFIYADEVDVEPTKIGYVFEGWSEPVYDENLNVIYNAIFRPGRKMDYSVSWYDSDTGEYIAGTETRSGTEASYAEATKEDKEKGKDVGYVYDESNPKNVPIVLLSEDGPNEIKLYFKYNPAQVSKRISYKVSWYDSAGNILKYEIRTGDSGTTVTIGDYDKQYSGYVFDENNSNNLTSLVLSEDGTNELKMYFKLASQVSEDITTVNSENKSEEYTYNFRGLHYNEKTRKVSFKVKNLQAGCKIRVGIKVITPTTVDDLSTEQIELRKDFYNFALGEERNKTNYSNTVHAWMGDENASTYKVSYSYIGEVPLGVSDVPSDVMYSEGANVSVAIEPKLSGYKFSGWSSSNVEVKNNNFKMPSQNVTLVGSFQKDTSYKVGYSIEGEIPPNYVPPSDKEYYQGDRVILDSLKKGDIFGGYKFLGWEAQGILVEDDNSFTMPESDLSFTGKFEEIKYKVEYQFISDVLPSGADEMLPEIKYYKPGEIVKLEEVEDIEGYHFLGWYSEDNFVMPAEDVLIKGEWKERKGIFSLVIDKIIVSVGETYRIGDIIKYQIKVMNPENYAVKNVIVEEKNTKVKFLTSPTNIYKNTNNLVEIASIAANSSVIIEAVYQVTDEDSGVIKNTAEIIGAEASNDYDLDTSKTYIASTNAFLQSKVRICNQGIEDTKSLKYHIENDDYDTWISIFGGSCKVVYVSGGEYSLTEVLPQEYVLENVTINTESYTNLTSNKVIFQVNNNENYEIVFSNQYRRQGFYKASGNVDNTVVDRTLYRKVQTDASRNLYGARVLLPEKSMVEENIYYYTSPTYNNVIFANKCWKIIRTTETKGVKLLYNGLPVDGKCNSTGDNTEVGKSLYNPKGNYFSHGGYMYNTLFEVDAKMRNAYTNEKEKVFKAGTLFGRTVTYKNGVYTLNSTLSWTLQAGGSFSKNHYTCFTNGTTCSTVYFVYYWYNNPAWFIPLRNGQTIQDAVELMFGIDDDVEDKLGVTNKQSFNYLNKKNSIVKTAVDNWYRSNMTAYTKYLEDTVWCNNRKSNSVSGVYGGFGETASLSNNVGFGEEYVSVRIKYGLSCPRTLDQFTVSTENGNGDLTYPVGLLTYYESYIAAKAIPSGTFWLMSPKRITSSSTESTIANSLSYITISYHKADSTSEVGLHEGNSYGIKPAISLKEGILYSKGNGTVNNPYIIVED